MTPIEIEQLRVAASMFDGADRSLESRFAQLHDDDDGCFGVVGFVSVSKAAETSSS